MNSPTMLIRMMELLSASVSIFSHPTYNSSFSRYVGFMQSTIGFGERSSAARSYLASNYRQRNNLHILTDTTVTQILSTALSVRPDFRLVELAKSATGSLSLSIDKSFSLKIYRAKNAFHGSQGSHPLRGIDRYPTDSPQFWYRRQI